MVEEGEIDFVVVREGTEGLYVGNGGVVRAGTPAEIATEVSVNTAYGVERVVRDAFERATRRRNKVTLVHKHNVLVHAGGLWQRIFAAVAAEYPQVTTDYLHVDAATIFLVTGPGPVRRDRHRQPVRRHPHRPGRGRDRRHRAGGERQHQPDRAPSRRCSSRCTARAPDIAGQRIADPTATILSVALLLDHLGLSDEAARVEKAVLSDLAARTGRRRTQRDRRRDRVGGLVGGLRRDCRVSARVARGQPAWAGRRSAPAEP